MKQTKVALRSRPISRNRRSLYLDYYPAIRNAEMKTIRQETLGIYIFDKPRSSMQKLHNEEILAKAELIRCYRVAELDPIVTLVISAPKSAIGIFSIISKKRP